MVRAVKRVQKSDDDIRLDQLIDMLPSFVERFEARDLILALRQRANAAEKGEGSGKSGGRVEGRAVR